jgi:2-polyprenyl-3-methyl-5-hydroxy-6-metoxy-1,4-benzoquinol methylase
MKDTRDRLIENYNSFRRRPTVENLEYRQKLFHIYKKLYQPWLSSGKDHAILDIACGEGSLLYFLKENGFHNLAGFDLSAENVEICHRLGLGFVVQQDALLMEKAYPAGAFDLIFARSIIEHVPKTKAVDFVEQAARLLKPGGTLILHTPNLGSLLGIYPHFNDLTHEFGLTEQSAVDLMSMAGFSLENISVMPLWNTINFSGELRKTYWRLIHWLIYLGEGDARPRIASRNMLIAGKKD